MSKHVVLLASASILALVLAGCGREGGHPTAPISSGVGGAAFPGPDLPSGGFVGGPGFTSAGFFPLEIGNRWHYVRRVVTEFVPSDSSEFPPTSGFTDSIDVRLARTVVIGGRVYVDQEAMYRRDGLPSGSGQTFLRQDGTGLYEADWPFIRLSADKGRSPVAWDQLESGLPDAAARESFRAARARLEQKLAAIPEVRFGSFVGPPGLPSTPELERLSYPLRAHARWVIRREPLFAAEAEERQTLDLPPVGHLTGWRIHYTSELYGPQDSVYVWYGRDGYLAGYTRLEGGFDPQGTWVLLITERLDGIDLAGRAGRP